MSRARIFAGLDLGSETLRLGAAVLKEKEKKGLELLQICQVPSKGIRRGVVEKVDPVSFKISELVDQLEKKIGQKIEEVIVNISGSHIFLKPSRGVVAVSRADQQISQEDIDRVISGAQVVSLPSNRETLGVYPLGYIVDGSSEVKDPLGMKGARLEAEVALVCGFSPYIRNLVEAVNKANLDIIEIIPSALACAEAVLNSQQKELGVAVLDLGAWTCDLAVFEEGELRHLVVLPVGASHITNDLAIGLQTEIEIAELIKKELGKLSNPKKSKPTIEVTLQSLESEDKKTVSFSKKVVVKIVQARMVQIFESVNKELKAIGKARGLPAGVVLTGGGAKTAYIEEIGKKVLKLPCKIGVCRKISGLPQDPALSNLAGLLLKNIQSEEEFDNQNEERRFLSRLKNLFRIFMP